MLDKIKSNWERDMARNAEDVYGARWGGADVIQQLTKACKGEISGQVFEIGCGGGRWTKWLFENGAENVYASDVHRQAIEKTKAYEPRALVTKTDGETIPFDDNVFDMVFTWGVLLHLPTYLAQQYLIEAYRVADKLIFGLPSFETKGGKNSYKKFIENKTWRNEYFTGYFHHYTKDHIIQMCEYAGWKVNKTKIIRDREILCICQK